MATFPEAPTHPQSPSSAPCPLLPPVRSGIRPVSLESTRAFLTPKPMSFVQVLASFSLNFYCYTMGRGDWCNVPSRSEEPFPPSRLPRSKCTEEQVALGSPRWAVTPQGGSGEVGILWWAPPLTCSLVRQIPLSRYHSKMMGRTFNMQNAFPSVYTVINYKVLLISQNKTISRLFLTVSRSIEATRNKSVQLWGMLTAATRSKWASGAKILPAPLHSPLP